MNNLVELIIQAYTREYRLFMRRITDDKIYEIYWYGYMK